MHIYEFLNELSISCSTLRKHGTKYTFSQLFLLPYSFPFAHFIQHTFHTLHYTKHYPTQPKSTCASIYPTKRKNYLSTINLPRFTLFLYENIFFISIQLHILQYSEHTCARNIQSMHLPKHTVNSVSANNYGFVSDNFYSHLQYR
jgi:hypothetical protein